MWFRLKLFRRLVVGNCLRKRPVRVARGTPVEVGARVGRSCKKTFPLGFPNS